MCDGRTFLMIDFEKTEQALQEVVRSQYRQEVILWVIAALLLLLILVVWFDGRKCRGR
jgi:hypothetical protein